MIREQHDIDLSTIADKFTTCGDYTKEVILSELEYWREHTDFLAILWGDSDSPDCFAIGYRSRNSLWIAQMWNSNPLDIKFSKKVLGYIKRWAKERKMTSISTETKRNEFRAMERYGWKEYSVNMRMEL